MDVIFSNGGRVLLLSTLSISPWLLAGAPLPTQPWLFGGILLALICVFIGREVYSPLLSLSKFHWAFVSIGFLAITIGVVQFALPLRHQIFKGAVLANSLDVPSFGSESSPTISIYPAATRLMTSRFVLGLCAFLGGAYLFNHRKQLQLLWGCLALNGAALSIFGYIQRATWDGKLYWKYSLNAGGQPFASFVSRNCAAGFLALCLAASLGLFLSNKFQERRDPTVDWEPRKRGSSKLNLFALICIVLNCAGILGTFSRAGISCSVLALFITASVLFASPRWRRILLPIPLAAVSGFGILIWSGFDEQLKARLQTLRLPFSMDGRATHWSDMVPAISDHFVFGSGWGTYLYANRPYQNHIAYGWYVNADNQYLEMLIEGGILGFMIPLLLLIITGWMTHRLFKNGQMAEAIVGLFILVTQGIHAVVDFGMMIPANFLTIAVLIGSICPQSHAGINVEMPSRSRVQQLVKYRRSKRLSIALAVIVLLGSLPSWFEIARAGRLSQFRYSIPSLSEPEQLTSFELDSAIAQAEALSEYRSDDAEFQAMLGNLWIYRYRLEVFQRLLNLNLETQRNRALLWERTHPSQLLTTMQTVLDSGIQRQLNDIRKDELTLLYLLPANDHFEQARNSCQLLPKIGIPQASLAPLLHDGSSQHYLRTEASLSPSTPSVLRSCAELAAVVRDNKLLLTCLRQELSLDPESLQGIVRVASQFYSPAEVATEVLPSDPALLINFAKLTENSLTQQIALKRAKQLLRDVEQHDDVYLLNLAEISYLENDEPKAEKHASAALQANPFNWQAGILYSDIMTRKGNLEAAKKQLKFMRSWAPLEAKIDQRLKKVLNLEL